MPSLDRCSHLNTASQDVILGINCGTKHKMQETRQSSLGVIDFQSFFYKKRIDALKSPGINTFMSSQINRQKE